jgi:hypothetical protein
MSDSQRIEDLSRRLDRTNRHLKALLALLVVAGVLALVGWKGASPGAVRASALEIVDDQGKVRARLDANADSTDLLLYDAKGSLAVEISAPGNGGMIALRDYNQKERARLYGFGPASGVMFWDANGRLRQSVPSR